MELAPLEKGFLCLVTSSHRGELDVEQVPAETAGKAGYVEGGCVIAGPQTRLSLRQLLPRGSVDVVLPHLVIFLKTWTLRFLCEIS